MSKTRDPLKQSRRKRRWIESMKANPVIHNQPSVQNPGRKEVAAPVQSARSREKTLDLPEEKMSESQIRSTVECSNLFPFVFMKNRSCVEKLQLIKGSNNHATRKHPIKDVVVNCIVYNPAGGKFNTVKISAHYCEKCHVYFEFYNSFREQMKQNNIKVENVATKLVDEHDREYIFQSLELHKYSKLSRLGYHVGKGGLSDDIREYLLRKIIKEKYMTAAEIKDLLNWFINFNGKNSYLSHCVPLWEKDILFVDKLIAEKNRK